VPMRDGVRSLKATFAVAPLRDDSGAHSRCARNLGGAEPAAVQRVMYRTHQEVRHGAIHPSRVVRPILLGSGA
jgi:hypothetical protein